MLFNALQSVQNMQCFICKVSLSCSAIYAKCPYYAVLCIVQGGMGRTRGTRPPPIVGRAPPGLPETVCQPLHPIQLECM